MNLVEVDGVCGRQWEVSGETMKATREVDIYGIGKSWAKFEQQW